MANGDSVSGLKIGFIGQGFIGKNMADDFAERGFSVTRYALEGEYAGNREAIAGCDIVFIAVPTPTTPDGFDPSALKTSLPLVGKGKVAVIKSTILPGTTRKLQAEFPYITVMHSPEFLREKYAKVDTREPLRNIVGVVDESPKINQLAEQVLEVLPKSLYNRVCKAEEAEMVKYGGNCFLMMKVVYMNLIFDLCEKVGADYEVVAEAMSHDPRIGTSHMRVVDNSGHEGAKAGRGAGGHCFPKDWAALKEFFAERLGDDKAGIAILEAIETKNLELLEQSDKDADLIKAIYGRTSP